MTHPKLRHVASVSGGKDSVAMCLHLRELGIPHDRVFMDTGWEHPDLYDHLEYLESVLGPIVRIRAKMPTIPGEVEAEVQAIEALVGSSPSGFVRWCVKKLMFPSRLRRWCTRSLKIRPFLDYVDQLDEDIVNVVGIRAEESVARSRLPEWEEMPGAAHVEVWRPLLRWSESDVIDIHARHDVRPCSLYLEGSTRVGCWPCIQSNKTALSLLAQDPRRVEAIRRLEVLVGQMKEAKTADAGGEMGNSPHLFQRLWNKTDGQPCVPIDDVLTWASTERGGRQVSLDVSWGRESGCVRWGMCEGVKP